MYRTKTLIGFIILFYVLFVVFQFSGYDTLATNVAALVLPGITLLYFTTVKEKTLYFSLFLVLFSLSELMVFIDASVPDEYYIYYYYVGNILNIVSYMFLLFEVCKSLGGLHVLKNFKMHIIVLTILNVYIGYVLFEIVIPDIAFIGQYYIEMIYNIVMLLLLSVSLLNYFYKDNTKSLLYFLGALCIVFCEVISVAYLYVSQKGLLNFFAVTLAFLAYYFLFKQSKLENTKEGEVQMRTETD